MMNIIQNKIILPCTSATQCLGFKEGGRFQGGSPDDEVADDDDDEGNAEANSPENLFLTTSFVLKSICVISELLYLKF